jgi:hypothetical protein
VNEIKKRILDEFYASAAEHRETDINSLLPPGISKEIGHFNVFDLAETVEGWKRKAVCGRYNSDKRRPQEYGKRLQLGRKRSLWQTCRA